MTKFVVSSEKINAVSAALFLIGIIIINVIGPFNLWSDLLVNLGIVLAVRQLLVGRPYDLIVILIVFGGCFATLYFHYAERVVVSTLLGVGALYLIVAESLSYYSRYRSLRASSLPPIPLAHPDESAKPDLEGSSSMAPDSNIH